MYELGEELWDAVVADWRTAPLRPELAAALGFLETMTLRPDELTAADAERVRAAGVSDQALRDAVLVCALFNMIDRLADSFGWDVLPFDAFRERAQMMFDGGYSIEAVVGRV